MKSVLTATHRMLHLLHRLRKLWLHNRKYNTGGGLRLQSGDIPFFAKVLEVYIIEFDN